MVSDTPEEGEKKPSGAFLHDRKLRRRWRLLYPARRETETHAVLSLLSLQHRYVKMKTTGKRDKSIKKSSHLPNDSSFFIVLKSVSPLNILLF